LEWFSLRIQRQQDSVIGIVIGEVVIATGAKRSAKRDTTSKSGSVKIEGAGSGANARKELTGNSVSAKKNADTKTGLNDREPRSVERGFFVPDLVFMPLVSTRLACFSLNTSSGSAATSLLASHGGRDRRQEPQRQLHQ
jgi:hypothetical protein